MTQPTANPDPERGWSRCKEMHGTSPQLWFLMLPMLILVVFNDATRRIFFFLFFFFLPYKFLSEALVDSWKEEHSLPSQQLAYLMDCQGTIPSDCQFLGAPPPAPHLTPHRSPYISTGQFVQEGSSWAWQGCPPAVKPLLLGAPTAPGPGAPGAAWLLAEELGCREHHILAF